MVWFQCEDCGENLKKPKLPNHFRICSAYKLSCIDCGVMFDQQSVQAHTQCITEAEKYGPKGQGKADGTPAKPSKDKPKPDVDINVGLSERPPWFCSLCNTKATSKQTLLLHADGKKHRAKARAYTANQQAKSSEESAPTNNDSIANTPKDELPDAKKENGHSNGALEHDNSSAEKGNGNVTTKKRKIGTSKDDDSAKELAKESGNGHVNEAEVLETPKKVKKAKHEAEENGEDKKAKCESGKDSTKMDATKEGSGKKKIKWKKLITSALKSTSDEALKMKKLQKLVLKTLQESGVTVDDDEFKTTLEHKVNSSTKFTVDGKYVRLAVK